MRTNTIALATAFAPSSTLAFAQVGRFLYRYQRNSKPRGFLTDAFSKERSRDLDE